MEPKFKQRGNSVILYYSHKQVLFRMATGVQVSPTLFNGTRIIGNNHKDENLVLDNMMAKIKAIIFEYKLKYNDNPSVDHVKKEWDKPLVELQTRKELLTSFKQFIELKRPDVKDVRIYDVVYNDLHHFTKYGKVKYVLEDVNETFKDKLKAYYLDRYKATKLKRTYETKEPNKHKPFYKNTLDNVTIRKRFKVIGTFMKKMNSIGFTRNEEYKKWAISDELKVINKKQVVTISIKEFNELIQRDLSSNKRLEYVRDLYLLSCSTGLRYCDVIRIGPDNIKTINGEECIEINVQKLDVDLLRIPLNDISKGILSKYGNSIRYISNKCINDYLDELFSSMGFDSNIQVMRRSGGAVTITDKKKYEVLRFHSSRKFFISYCIRNGVDIDKIMAWTGHKGNFDVFYKYINEGLEDKDLMKNAFSSSKFGK